MNGMAFLPGTDEVVIESDGGYLITYQVTARSAAQWAIAINDTVINASRIGLATSNTPAFGQIALILQDNDTIKIVNNSSIIPDVILSEDSGGSNIITNASMSISKIFNL